METDWTWVSYDGVIKKKIFSVGTSSIHPFDNSKCKVRFLEVSVEDGQILEHCAEVGSKRDMTIGKAETLFDRTVERVLQTMVSQEVAQCELKLKDVTCNVKLELIQFEQSTKPLHRLSEEEKLAVADNLKTRASELIRDNRYEDAVALLNRAFRCVCWAKANFEKTGFSELYFSIIANLSLCSLKLNDNNKTIALCSRILDHRPNHVKCLLRRGTAFDSIQETEKAKKDALSVLAVEPKNKTAELLLEKIQTHIVKQNLEYSVLAKKMLHLNK